MASKATLAASQGVYKPSPEDIKRQQDYQASDDVRTLHQAHKIKSDPARHGRAKAKMQAHLASLKALMAGGGGKKKGDKEDAADRAGPDSEISMPYGS